MDAIQSVLIIEDEPDLMYLLKRQVVLNCIESPSFRLDSTNSIKTGMKWAAENNYTAIILDLHLPDGHGNELINQRESLCKDSYIVVLSGDIEDCSLSDDDKIYFLEKPFEEKKLNFYLNMICKQSHLEDDKSA